MLRVTLLFYSFYRLNVQVGFGNLFHLAIIGVIDETVTSTERVQGFVHVISDYCGLTVLSICPDIEKHITSDKFMINQAIVPTIRPGIGAL
jgi:hypothetical protein